MRKARFSRFFGPGEEETALLSEYVASGLEQRPWPAESVAALVCASENGVEGATIFHDWRPECGTLCMSGYGKPGWMTLSHIYLAHWYVFDGAECRMAVMQVSERNDAMRRVAEKFGYTGTLIPDLRAEGEGEWVYTLTRDGWRESPFTRRVERNMV